MNEVHTSCMSAKVKAFIWIVFHVFMHVEILAIMLCV
jgi:hypothetical protein